MNERTSENCRHLIYVLDAPETLRRQLLEVCGDNLVHCFCEVILNIVYGELIYGVEERDILQLSKPLLLQISKESGTLKLKRRLINELEPHALDLIRSILSRYV
jgi:hypothetical protein